MGECEAPREARERDSGDPRALVCPLVPDFTDLRRKGLSRIPPASVCEKETEQRWRHPASPGPPWSCWNEAAASAQREWAGRGG